MDISLDEVKEYLRIDGDEDDSLISFFISAAKTHLENAGVTDKESELYKLAVLIYVTDAYENRSTALSGNKVAGIVLQLR
ncbi:head-tail connector protein [Bacillus sp. FSL K6-1109]|uniref:Phage gp6-like head-tail connector protein n=1 Tax=Bacillus licheniformis TaxID=1402 RepID=A0AB37GKC9_BACLI|nr:head-tail connector protein [Bacillus licheniformis]MDE1375149.1 head-tail connector protein [Bacillus licheniformis]MDE1388362.1 head-tail connector protein [Bacillus licheniformis]MDE1396011.1 head-tail connector protein [Bacillus licheniformis]OJT65412.1 DNA-packaging protein [Bacillus licheniformis]QPR71863.1 phage gp6-like head-tail connector protein [Bacillus licheniformis]